MKLFCHLSTCQWLIIDKICIVMYHKYMIVIKFFVSKRTFIIVKKDSFFAI